MEAATYRGSPQAIALCATHGRDTWQDHHGYSDNRDGTVSCKFCPWGSSLPGYYRVLNGRIVDLRTLNRE